MSRIFLYLRIMEKQKKIWDYFDEDIEFPKEVASNPIPYGTVWTYISHTFLNGFINHVDPVACYVLNRYTPEEEKMEGVKVIDKNKPGSWHDFEGTKKELIDAVVSEVKEFSHTALGCFSDDVVILAKIPVEYGEKTNAYMFFWFDCDVSDCSIGRFKTDDTEEQIIQSVETWLIESFKGKQDWEGDHGPDSAGYYKLPLSFLKGWKSF